MIQRWRRFQSGLHSDHLRRNNSDSFEVKSEMTRDDWTNKTVRLATGLFGALLLLVCHQSVLALDPQKAITQYILKSWTSDDGLPQNSVVTIAQTRDGYLWFGTNQGLARFDGVSFTVFDQTNTPEIKSNSIKSLYEDKEGNFWIGTTGGLNKFRDGKFTSFTTSDGLSNNIVAAIYEDRRGTLWIGTDGGGLNKFDGRSFTHFTKKDGLSSDMVTVIYEDIREDLWIGTYLGGLNRFKHGKFTSFTTKDGLSNDSVWTVYEDKQGALWIGTESGLNKFQDGNFISYQTKDGLSNDIVKKIYEDRDGNFWIGTYGGGLNRLKDGKFTSFSTSDGLSNHIVRTIFEDQEGSLWIGTESGGLNRLSDPKFTSFTTREGLSNDLACAIYEDREGTLWIGTYGGGLNKFKDGKFTSFTTRDGLSNNLVIAITDDKAGNLWIGTYGGGLNKFKDGRFTAFTTKDGLASDFVRSVYEDSEGSLWVGTYDGLNRFKDGKLTPFTIKDGLADDVVVAMHEDKDGALWMGTRAGLSKFKDGEFTSFTTANGLANNFVKAIYEDNGGSLWIGTAGGLSRFQNGKFTSFTSKNGLFDNSAYAILEDNDGNLWMSCTKGIFRVSKKQLADFAVGTTNSIESIVYTTADGMRSNECNDGQPAGLRSADGKFWFATLKGVAMINPNKIKLNTVQPPVAIERVVIDGNRFNPGENAQAPPGAGDLEFVFTAMSFVAPKKVSFKYKLEGYDNNWVDAGTSRTAHYTNIPPGNYRFRLMASNNDGLWNERGAAFELYLRPHFYQRYWFYAAIVVGVVLLGLTLHGWRVQTLENRKRVLERLVNERTENLLAMTRELENANRRQADFVSGVSHELKTPLTLIHLYGETLLYGNEFEKEEQRNYFRIITRESERLTRLVNNILDFSRINRGVKDYSLKDGDLVAAVAETIDLHAEHLRRRGFAVDIVVAPALPTVRFDQPAVVEATLNLLDNAAKYSDGNKSISIRLFQEKSFVVLEVGDRGVGIPKDEHQKIFDQFYRGSNRREQGGYGLGLFLVQHIMDAHHGRVEVQSQPETGSVFRLLFPIATSRN
jgi:ligand-binding sensor domain-containing protein/signal transduction histidine kinase